MTYDLEEQEQIDAVKAWWAKYGNAILTVITLVLLAAAAWQWWGWHQRNQAAQASSVFEALQTAATQGQANQVLDASARLRDDYAQTPYASRGALVAAAALQQAGDAAAARQRLQWVIDSKDAALAPVARLRLASLLIDGGEAAQAASLLEGRAPVGFEALYADRRGDALFAQGQSEQAGAAWRAAIESMSEQDPLVSVVRLKLEALLPGGQA